MAIFHVRYAKKGGAAVAGVTHASVSMQRRRKTATGGAGVPGPSARIVSHQDLVVRLWGSNYPALLALVGSVKADVVVGYESTASTHRKKTAKNVKFTACLGSIQVPRKDAGGKIPKFGIEGHGCWGLTDTPALMLVDAVDP